MLYGRDGQPIATLGTLTDDGQHCEFQGALYRIGDRLFPDAQNRRVCIDAEGTNCVWAQGAGSADTPPPGPPTTGVVPAQSLVLSSGGNAPHQQGVDAATLAHLARSQGALGPVRGQIDDRCILNEGNQQVSPVGHRSADGKHCVIEREVKDRRTGKTIRTERQQIPFGQNVYRDPSTGRVCTKENAKSQRDCPVAVAPAHNRPMSAGERAGYHGAIGLTGKVEQYTDAATQGIAQLSHPAELSTAAIKAGERAASAAKRAVATLRDPAKAKEAARSAWDATVDSAEVALRTAQNWWNKPPEKKLDDLAEAGGSGLVDVPVNMATGAAVGSVLRTGERALDIADDARKVERAAGKGKKAAQLMDEAEHATPAPAKGGAYVLKDPETDRVMRTGRTKDHNRRRDEHQTRPDTAALDYEAKSRSDDYAIQRGHEQLLHDEHQPSLNKIRPISPKNPNRDKYIRAAREYLKDRESGD
jgi:hypothetical protein